MSQIISFSSDKEFATQLEGLAIKSGYNNRSRFIRDSVLHYADLKQRGELMQMEEDLVLEGHLIVYYQHGKEQKLMVGRTDSLDVAAYHHSSRVGHSCHSCVDVIHVNGKAAEVRAVIEKLQNTINVDKVSFISAPIRLDDECC